MQKAQRLLYYIGAQIHQGQTLGGVAKGPDAIRSANLFKSLGDKNITVKDMGNVSQETISQSDIPKHSSKINNLAYLDPLLHQVHRNVKEAAEKKDGFVLTVGGDHSVATGSISGLKEVHPKLKVIWVDAHADIGLPHMTDSTTYHGKPVSHLMGLARKEDLPGFEWLKPCLDVSEIVYIGIRDLDEDEKETLAQHKIKCFTLDHIIQYGGIGNVMEQAISYLDPKKEGLPLHASFDIDGVDPIYAPGTGTKARGGLTYRESNYIMRRLNSENLISMDMVEINPELEREDHQQKYFGDDPHIEASKTVALGCDLILSAIGRNDLFFLDKKN